MFFAHANNFAQFLPLLTPLLVIEIILKSIALWKAARHNQVYWFIAIVIVNSVGILPLIYILFFQQDRKAKKK
ncbi:MAG TPA: DUF5652 family protein [Patescibacteria group bacterium]|nr:DUF5652 family protein [Patescibacteria group bacterium]